MDMPVKAFPRGALMSSWSSKLSKIPNHQLRAMIFFWRNTYQE
jgi:hypothetical protein